MSFIKFMESINNKLEELTVDNNVEQGNERYTRLKVSTIMMVDDEPIMLEIIQALLEEAGYQYFIPVQQSSQAIDRLIKANPDILLLDLDMPEVNGFEVLKAVRALRKYQFLPVIILTASGDPDSKLKALELGAHGFSFQTG